MKARRLKDNEIVDVVRYEKPINRDEVYVDGKLRLYLPSDLDFDVEEAEQTESAVISGWVARDKIGNTVNLHPDEPYRSYSGCSKNGSQDYWCSMYLSSFPLGTNLFPSLTWESEPLEVEITIKAKKK